jgi:hypothetical protein
LANGRWVRVGAQEDVLQIFPKAPEIYHEKSSNPSNPRIGPFGSAEAPTGDLRELKEAEARHIGLGHTYRQIMLEEEFEVFLERTLG